ncbi:PH domain-containing protein [Thermoactinomyces sp. DSM 45892]|uniref:PH domain-containing protein n=1 Tax=Thermoactinomyces sp. DSM 45892 TaxID=1882753 RepID=UPI00089B58BC|nr:PH domain-containing protein [Thermoactinomyces sp. DSM 45892]SDZ12768.1 hypothetical protein SAMN05444416_11418 [Thermoactinomyces sp. DSM 45892]
MNFEVESGGYVIRPTRTLPKESLQVRQITAVFGNVIGVMLGIAGIFVFPYWEWPIWISGAIIGISVIGWLAEFFWYNRLQWKYFLYDVNERDVVIQKGVFFQKLVYVPMTRIQHVDIKTGPLMRRYGLAELRVHTAGSGTFEIGYIMLGEAEQLCEQVRQWIKVDEDEFDAETE